MAAIRVGIQITQQQATYRQIRRARQEVDASGADTLFNGDHFFPLSGDLNGAHLDNWTALGRWPRSRSGSRSAASSPPTATATPTCSSGAPWAMARTLDHISDGRFILGIGSGWN